MSSDAPSPVRSPRAAFARSGAHLYLGLATLGLGFASGELLGLIAGMTLYALGWLYLPDSGWFRRSLERKQQAAAAREAAARTAGFARERDRLIGSLSIAARGRFDALASLCREIEAATTETQGGTGGPSLAIETRLRKLDELLWTYLRLLGIEQTLEVFLESERREGLPRQIGEITAEIAALEPQAAAEPQGSRARLLQSKRDRLHALSERVARGEQARGHLELARAEQARLVDQVKLLRADIVATRNPDALSLRIDHSVEHLAETNRWLGELAEFQDLTAQLPPGTERLGLGGAAQKQPPPLAQRARAAGERH